MKKAFTLAEVLITLGIIGVVAALTIPSLVQNHKNQVVENKLKKFYSEINQAIQMAELDYGEREGWYNLDDVNTDKDGKPVNGRNPKEKFVYKYFVPYMKVLKVELNSKKGNNPIIYLSDGSVFENAHFATSNFNDWVFYTTDREKCLKRNVSYGACAFYFLYIPTCSLAKCEYVGRTFEPYKYGWDGSESKLLNNCETSSSNHYCAALIQYNGWKIPKNYPFRVSY